MTDTEVVPVGDDRAEPLSYRRIDILLSVVTTLLGVTVIVVAAVTIPESAAAYTFDPVGPRGFAFVIGALTTALGAVLVVNRLLAWRRIAAEGIGVDEAELGGDDPRYPASSRRAFAIIAVTFVYAVLLDPTSWLFIILGAVWGVFVGAMPGIGAPLGFALLLPLTFTLDPVVAVAMLLALSVGNAFGNSLPAITLAIPGSPATIMTVLDGHALFKRGKGDVALGAAYIAALGGQLISIPLFVLLVIPLANLAYVFQAPELFGIYVLGMVAVVSIASANILKGLLSALFGLIVGLVGLDPLTTFSRFTFDVVEIRAGFDETAVIIGLLALGEIFRSLRQNYSWTIEGEVKRVRLPRLSEMGGGGMVAPLVGGTVLGTLIGAIPGAGSS